jgi:hypothetical protein
MRLRLFVATAFLCAALPLPVAAQDYPSRPTRIFVPAAPGGTTDLLARLFGAKLSEAFRQPVTVENRSSASGVIAGELTAKAPPDGYTLLLAYHQHTVNAALNPNLPYHPVNDFTPITQLTSAGLLLVLTGFEHDPPRRGKAALAVALFLGALALGTTKVLPMSVAGLGGLLAMVLTGCVDGQRALGSCVVRVRPRTGPPRAAP